VFTWGAGPQLGHGVFSGTGDNPKPQVVKALSKQRIKHVRCGWNYTIALSHNGDLFSWGLNQQGQLGVGDKNDRVIPVEVEAMRVPQKGGRSDRVIKALELACGGRHVVVVTTIGRVFAWGWNRNGQLGLGHTSDCTAPALVGGRLHNLRVTQVAAGWRHTMVLTENYQLFAWGQAGCISKSTDRRGPFESEEVEQTTHFESHQPAEVSLPSVNGRAPCKISCSWSHSMAVTSVTFSQKSVADAGDENPAATTQRSAAPPQPAGGSRSPDISRQQLNSMSAEELRNLVSGLQSQPKGRGGGLSSTQAGRRPQAEESLNFLSRTSSRPSPKDAMQEKDWNTSNRNAGGRKASEYQDRVRSELKQFGTSTERAFSDVAADDQEEDDAEFSAAPAAKSPAHKAMATQRKVEDQRKKREQDEQQRRAEAEHDAVRQRREREGAVQDMSFLFSTTARSPASSTATEARAWQAPADSPRSAPPAQETGRSNEADPRSGSFHKLEDEVRALRAALEENRT
jgi:hypothetical protein